MKFGDTIKNLRNERNYTQQELADLVELSRSSLSQIENNIKVPSKKTMAKISKVLGVPEIYFHLNSLDKSDIPEDKQELFEIIFPGIQTMIKKLMV